jgi:hypothetical protein
MRKTDTPRAIRFSLPSAAGACPDPRFPADRFGSPKCHWENRERHFARSKCHCENPMPRFGSPECHWHFSQRHFASGKWHFSFPQRHFGDRKCHCENLQWHFGSFYPHPGNFGRIKNNNQTHNT